MQTYGREGGAALLAEVMPASQPRKLRAGLVVVAHLARVGVLLECELALGLVVAEELHHRLLARTAARLQGQAKHSLYQSCPS